MKKVLTVLGGVLAIGVTIAIVVGVLMYTGVFNKDVLNEHQYT